MDHWQWLIAYEPILRKWCHSFGCGRYDEEMWDEVIDRLPRLFELWTPEKGPLYPYVKRNLRWYMYKRVGLLRKRVMAHLEADPVYHDRRDACDAVQSLLSGLTEVDKKLILLHDILGYTFTEMGDMLGMSRAWAQRLHARALAQCQKNNST